MTPPYFGAGDEQPEQPVQTLVQPPLHPAPHFPPQDALQPPPQPPVQLPEQPEQLPLQLPTQLPVHVPEQPVHDREQPEEQFQLHVPPQSIVLGDTPPSDVVALNTYAETCDATFGIVATSRSAMTTRSLIAFKEIIENFLI